MIIAIIPARGGSKRIPRKNIRPFAGKPMIVHSIDTARASGLFDRIKRPESCVHRRHRIAAIYDRQLADLPLILPYQDPGAYSTFHLYVVRVDPQQTTLKRRVLFGRLRSAGIGVSVQYIPVYTQSYYRNLGFRPGHLAVSERYSANAVNLRLYPTMTEAKQDTVITALKGAVEESDA
jgi:dTDP-4-amino-4,6-dideoxygalactose transaminase